MMLQTITNSRAIERQSLAEHLRAVAPGHTTTYAEMSAAAGTDVRNIRHVIDAVRRDLRDEDCIVLESVSNVGYRRMTDLEVATIVPNRRRRKAHRQATIGLKECAVVRHPEQLPPGERMQFLGGMALLGAMAAISTHSSARRIIGEIKNSDTATLPVAQTLAALSHIK